MKRKSVSEGLLYMLGACEDEVNDKPDCHCTELRKRVKELEDFVRIVGEGDCALPDLTERCYCITCSARKLTPSSEVCKWTPHEYWQTACNDCFDAMPFTKICNCGKKIQQEVER